MKTKLIFASIILMILLSAIGISSAQEEWCNITGFSGPYIKDWSRTTYLVWWEDYPFGLQPGLLTGEVTFQMSREGSTYVRYSSLPFRGYDCDGEVAWWTQSIDFNKLPCGNWVDYNPEIKGEGGFEIQVKRNPAVGFWYGRTLGCNLYESIILKNYTPPKQLDIAPYPIGYPYP